MSWVNRGISIFWSFAHLIFVFFLFPWLSLSKCQVIYRTLPKWESLDPYGLKGQQQLKVTNIRIRLLKHQKCHCQAKDLTSAHEPLPTRHFAIYDLIVKGSCFCNGHADQCVPMPGYQPIRDRTNHVVRGEKLMFSNSGYCLFLVVFKSFINSSANHTTIHLLFFSTHVHLFSVASLTCFDSSDHVVTRHALVFHSLLRNQALFPFMLAVMLRKQTKGGVTFIPSCFLCSWLRLPLSVWLQTQEMEMSVQPAV